MKRCAFLGGILGFAVAILLSLHGVSQPARAASSYWVTPQNLTWYWQPEQASQSVAYNDGQIEEQDVQYGDDVSPYLKAGKPVLDAEYQSEPCSSNGQMQAQFDLNLTGATFKPCFAASPQGPPIGGTSSTLSSTSTSSTTSTPTTSSSTSTATDTTTSSTSSTQTTTTTSTSTSSPLKPTNTKRPMLSGTAKQGDQLKTTTGTWTGSPKFGYAWQRCQASCQVVKNATRSTYNLGSSDVGFQLQAIVTAMNKSGSSSATTGLSAVVTKQRSRGVRAEHGMKR